tara:strand:- start:316 stop:1083 length:768 start_codon:yes stop_codon:yes gene_type:complete
MSYSRTVYCGWCSGRGHNQRSCPQKKEYIKTNPNTRTARMDREQREHVKWSAKHRTCGYCVGEGHNRQTCPDLKKDQAFVVKKNKKFMKWVVESFKEVGLGVGTLLSKYNPYRPGSEGGDELYLVTKINWDRVNFAEFTSYKEHDEMFELRRLRDGNISRTGSTFMEFLHTKVHEKIREEEGFRSVWEPRETYGRRGYAEVVSGLSELEVERQMPKNIIKNSKVSKTVWLNGWGSDKYKSRNQVHSDFLAPKKGE